MYLVLWHTEYLYRKECSDTEEVLQTVKNLLEDSKISLDDISVYECKPMTIKFELVAED